MLKCSAQMLACLLLLSIVVSLTTGPANADTYSVNLGAGTHQYPQPYPSAPYQNPSPISTGGNLLLPMFNPTTGFLTKVDMSFYYSTGYGGTLSNMTSYTVPEASFQDTGSKTAWFNFTPVGTLWTHNAPSEGRSATGYLAPYRSTYHLNAPTRGYGSPTYTITNPNDVRQFVGVGNDNSLIQGFIRSNYNLVASSSAVRIAVWQRMFAPRGTVTYHYNPFPPDPVDDGNGLGFSIAEGPSYGQGQVEPTPLGAKHKHKVQAFPGQGAVTEETGLVQRFTFSREDQGSDQTSVFINGLLDGFLSADEGGLAQALGVMELYNASDQLIDRVERLAVANSHLGQLEQNNVHQRFGMTVMLIPGNLYELLRYLLVFGLALVLPFALGRLGLNLLLAFCLLVQLPLALVHLFTPSRVSVLLFYRNRRKSRSL